MTRPRAHILLAALLALALAPRARAADHAFDLAVRQVAAALGTRPAHRHLLGFVDFIAWVGHPIAARGLHIAMLPAPAGGWPQALNLHHLLADRLPGWQCIVRDWSRAEHEQSLVYVRPAGGGYHMLVVDLSGDEADVVQVSLPRAQIVSAVDRHVRRR